MILPVVRKNHILNVFKLYYSTINKCVANDINKIRNIGILAHIDAGKTTTTERMLYYAGLINQMGEVHHGNTVTDHMAQERERGITITSAAVTFYWKHHQFNLIDTPGHIDFTMEVEQTLSVLDGAIVVLDGSAGVEAQTLTVWRQADRYQIPRIVFVNKMDRSDSSLEMCCNSIEDKLEVHAICLQLPVMEQGKVVGVVDAVTMEKITYDFKSLDKQINYSAINETNDPELYHAAKLARAKIVDKLTELNDELADLVIMANSMDDIKTVNIIKALNQVTFNRQAVPVLMGSAYKNLGIQPLMDAVILYLSSPNETNNKHFTSFETNMCARAFKIKHDRQKGPLVFFRIYNGQFSKSHSKIYSIQQEKSEQFGRLYVAHADEFKEVDQIQNGNIAVASGLKYILPGDLVTNSQSTAQRAKMKMLKMAERKLLNNIDANAVDHLFASSTHVPEPVFFCSIEPPSLAYQTGLEQALNELQREDPSLRVTHDNETGQTVLSGMGELHLEIIKDRILKEYKIDAELGPLHIAYREAPINNVTDSHSIETKIGNSRQAVGVKLSIIRKNKASNNVMKLDHTNEAASNLAGIFPKHLLAIRHGIEVGLVHGPKIGSQVVNVEVILHMFEVGKGTSDNFITGTVTQLVHKLLKDSGTNILEPVMYVEIVTPDDYLSAIMADLSRRRSIIKNVTIRGKMKVVISHIPLSELLGYVKVLRTISSGTATFSMEYSDYQIMSAVEENAAVQSVRGF